MHPPNERRRGFAPAEQLRVLVPLVVVWAGGFGILSAVAMHNDVGEFLLDPSYHSGGDWYIGLVSQLGVVAWAVGSVSAFWSSWIARRSGRLHASRFLAWASFAGAVLLFDDLFEVHAVVHNITGLPKVLTQFVVVLPTVWWFLRYAADVRRTRWQVLAASVVALAVSVAVDTIVAPSATDRRVLWEDGAKFLGILAWATYHVLTAADIAGSVLRTTSGPRSEPDDGGPNAALRHGSDVRR